MEAANQVREQLVDELVNLRSKEIALLLIGSFFAQQSEDHFQLSQLHRVFGGLDDLIDDRLALFARGSLDVFDHHTVRFEHRLLVGDDCGTENGKGEN